MSLTVKKTGMVAVSDVVSMAMMMALRNMMTSIVALNALVYSTNELSSIIVFGYCQMAIQYVSIQRLCD